MSKNRPPQSPFSLSVIIPSLNGRLIGEVLSRLQEQTIFDQIVEILVVGKDEKGSIPRDSAQVRLIDTGWPVNAATARNIGIEASQGDILLFIDDDCLPSPAWGAAHLAAHQNGADVVIGSVDPTGKTYWGLVYNLTLFHEFFSTSRAGKRQVTPSLNLSLKRSVIERSGVMDTTLGRAEDVEWGIRMQKQGYEPYFEPKAVITHLHKRNSFLPVWEDCARSGYFSRVVRLTHTASRPTQFANRILNFRFLIFLGAPIIAALVTLKIVGRHVPLFIRRPDTIAGIYLTKIAWCWGASRREMAG
ncbi:MAG: glycosyltransferase [Chloroflexota bacterium]